MNDVMLVYIQRPLASVVLRRSSSHPLVKMCRRLTQNATARNPSIWKIEVGISSRWLYWRGQTTLETEGLPTWPPDKAVWWCVESSRDLPSNGVSRHDHFNHETKTGCLFRCCPEQCQPYSWWGSKNYTSSLSFVQRHYRAWHRHEIETFKSLSWKPPNNIGVKNLTFMSLSP